MKTVVYLSNQIVKAVTGEERKGRLVITQAFAEEAPKLSIVNGQVTDDAAFTQFLKEFWEKHQLPRNKVYLVVNSTQTVIRFFETPRMPYRKMIEYLPREFSNIERMRNPVYSYQILGPGMAGNRCRVLGVVMERSFLAEHVKRFRSLGIHLASVEPAMEAKLRLLHHLEGLKGKTCAVQLLDGTIRTDILWTDGTFLHFNRSRMLASVNTPAFGAECARAVSALIQFARAEQVEKEITAVYLGGLGDGELALCESAIRQMYPNMEVESISDAAGNSVQLPKEGGCDLGGFAAPAGGSLAEAGRENLLYQYRLGTAARAREAALFRMIAPPVGAACVLTLILVFQAASWFRLTNRVDSCFDYMSDPLVLSGAARYDRLTAENEGLRSRLRATNQITLNMDSYPVMDTTIDQAVAHCAEDLVTANVVSFQAKEGTIQISSAAADQRSIHQFIDRLASETDLFSAVDYTGFEYVESDGVWKLYVKCYLYPPQGQEEAALTDGGKKRTKVKAAKTKIGETRQISAGKGAE